MSEKAFESKNLKPDCLDSLSQICIAEVDRFGEEAYILRFNSENAKITIRVVLNDKQSGADLIITNMTTLPESERGKGLGSVVVGKLLEWATKNGLSNIQAVQVQSDSERFWISNGFEKMNNETNDFKYIDGDRQLI